MVTVTAWSRTARAAAAVAVTAALVASPGTTVTVTPVAVVINGARPGPAFQGIGAISGGGGNSRLLIDYPPRERAQILDYLFSPHFGASLQMLKLEIGGGGFSSDGSEPSVEPVRGRPDCGAGYEFWLARQALARNPAAPRTGRPGPRAQRRLPAGRDHRNPGVAAHRRDPAGSPAREPRPGLG
jgi:hypothetical protein